MKTYETYISFYPEKLNPEMMEKLEKGGWRLNCIGGLYPLITASIYLSLPSDVNLSTLMINGMSGAYFKVCCGVNPADILYYYGSKLVSDV